MRPAIGEGISTVALSVSTSRSGASSATTSPSRTCTWRISASVSPSPRSGRTKGRAMTSPLYARLPAPPGDDGFCQPGGTGRHECHRRRRTCRIPRASRRGIRFAPSASETGPRCSPGRPRRPSRSHRASVRLSQGLAPMTTRGFLSTLLGFLLGVTTAAQAAPFAYVTTSFTDSVDVVDLGANAVVATIPVGDSPFGVAVHPSGTHVYVANWGSDTVSVIDTGTRTVV